MNWEKSTARNQNVFLNSHDHIMTANPIITEVCNVRSTLIGRNCKFIPFKSKKKWTQFKDISELNCKHPCAVLFASVIFYHGTKLLGIKLEQKLIIQRPNHQNIAPTAPITHVSHSKQNPFKIQTLKNGSKIRHQRHGETLKINFTLPMHSVGKNHQS